MATERVHTTSDTAWTLRKSVQALAIAPHTESITRTARLAYNVMIFKAQRMTADEEGGYSAPLSEIVTGFGATTRDSSRVQTYIEQMCTTLVRRFALSQADEAQAVLEGFAPASATDGEEGRVFTLLSEARFSRRGGERWVTWFFPPTIRALLIDPTRWARIDIKELASLSHYAGVALYEICSRYKDVPGGLTNRAAPSWWVAALRPDSDTKPREWRKFKNETLKPAVAEISQRTSLLVEVVEHKRGRSVVDVQFTVKRRQLETTYEPVDATLVSLAINLQVKEKDLDALVDELGEDSVRMALQAMGVRQAKMPGVPIKHPVAYLKQIVRRGDISSLFDGPEEIANHVKSSGTSAVADSSQPQPRSGLLTRELEISAELDRLSLDEVEHYAQIARESLRSKGMLTASIAKRFDAKQYGSSLVREYIKTAFAEDQYGPDWRVARSS